METKKKKKLRYYNYMYKSVSFVTFCQLSFYLKRMWRIDNKVYLIHTTIITVMVVQDVYLSQ